MHHLIILVSLQKSHRLTSFQPAIPPKRHRTHAQRPKQRSAHGQSLRNKSNLAKRVPEAIIEDEIYPMTIRRVPKSMRRFDYPWRLPKRVRMPTLRESNYRILYTPLRDNSGEGLGHAMATINADFTTALRLNLTYSHRIASYGSLTRPSEGNESYAHAGAIEQLFGWGVREIPRERVQFSICSDEVMQPGNNICRICNSSTLQKRRREFNLVQSPRKRWALRIEHVINIPARLSYRYPKSIEGVSNAVTEFIRKNDKAFTVFSMPSEYCMYSPAFSKFSPMSRSFFFHKYWDAHAVKAGGAAVRERGAEGMNTESFDAFVKRVAHGTVIQPMGRRKGLARLREDRINVAIHARRGDFFIAGRPMVSTQVFARVVRTVMAKVINERQDGFSRWPVTVRIYSEGGEVKGGGFVAGHDVQKMNDQFVDNDGVHLSQSDVLRMFREDDDGLGNVFAGGLDVELRVSENTVLSVHEMVAADVFVGSRSGLSHGTVASLSRAAFCLVPWSDADGEGSIVLFDDDGGDVSDDDLSSMRNLWHAFVEAHL